MADEKEKKIVPADPNTGNIITVKLVPQDGSVRINTTINLLYYCNNFRQSWKLTDYFLGQPRNPSQNRYKNRTFDKCLRNAAKNRQFVGSSSFSRTEAQRESNAGRSIENVPSVRENLSFYRDCSTFGC